MCRGKQRQTVTDRLIQTWTGRAIQIHRDSGIISQNHTESALIKTCMRRKAYARTHAYIHAYVFFAHLRTTAHAHIHTTMHTYMHAFTTTYMYI